MAEIAIRRMEKADIPGVMAVEAVSFAAPWTKEIYEQELNKNNFAHYFVMLLDERIIGYVGVWIVHEDAQITNIALHPSFRGKNIGEKLFGYALAFAFEQGATHISLEVRPSNKVAQNMYRKFGLKQGGIRKKYYPDNGEDALVMWAELTEINFKAFLSEGREGQKS